MAKTTIKTSDAPAAVGPYSQGMVVGNLVFVSGQLGLDPATGKLVEGGVTKQAAQALKNIEAILRRANCAMENVVKTTILLASMDDFKEVNAVYADHFGAHRPARATFAVQGLPLGGLVEIEAIAALEN